MYNMFQIISQNLH